MEPDEEAVGALPAQEHLASTATIDSDHPAVIGLAKEITGGLTDPAQMSRALFVVVRDSIRYDPYKVDLSVEGLRGSTALERKSGFCIPKAALLAALARAVGIPSRLGFADVKNHLASPKLLSMMGTDLFVFHGYTDLWIDKKWVKATPAFNRTLCEKIGVPVLEFDGANDAMLQQSDASGQRYIEYVKDRGRFRDVPVALISREFRRAYPSLMDSSGYDLKGVFENEATTDS